MEMAKAEEDVGVGHRGRPAIDAETIFFFFSYLNILFHNVFSLQNKVSGRPGEGV